MCESFRRFKESAINEGVAQGYTLGINEGEIKTLTEILGYKLGQLSESIVERIYNSSKEQLNQLKIKFSDIQTEDDLYKILA